MGNVKRVYVEKKPEYAVQAKDLFHEIRSYLGISTLTGVRVLIRYDVENISEETFEKACRGVFAEPPVDVLYKETFPAAEGARVFSVEFLPGQFDQRADSAVQCVQFIKEDEKPVIRTATTYVIEGELTDEQFEAVKHHCINPVDSRETGMEKPETLVTKFDEPANVVIFDGSVDRSPCGVGTSCKMAILVSRGELAIGDTFTYESVICTKFKGVPLRKSKVGDYDAIVPQITASAYITGFNHLVFDDEDPVKYGFRI